LSRRTRYITYWTDHARENEDKLGLELSTIEEKKEEDSTPTTGKPTSSKKNSSS